MIVAKHDEAHRYLAGQLKQRRIHRHYIALVHGQVKHDKVPSRLPLGATPRTASAWRWLKGAASGDAFYCGGALSPPHCWNAASKQGALIRFGYT